MWSYDNSAVELYFIVYNEPTNAQLIDKSLYCPYMFRHYCVIFRELIVSICQISHMFSAENICEIVSPRLHWHTYVT